MLVPQEALFNNRKALIIQQVIRALFLDVGRNVDTFVKVESSLS
jgi:hypothetical protein